MRRAIALCGGGTKGAYELGVWQALKELDIDYQIVTGTSIGSITGALMVTRDYDMACELWNSITLEDVMKDGVNLTTTIEGMYNQREQIRPFLKKYVKNKGADISPFIEFIDRMIDEDKVRQSDIDFGLVTVQVSSLKSMELTKEEIPNGRLKDFIMASSSIFPVFPMHKIDGETYLDGCYYDNLPIDLALKMGADEVIAVDLHTNPSHPNYVNKPYVTYIKPSRSLGTMLNFERQILDDNIQLGYYDAMKVFGCMMGDKYQFYGEDYAEYEEIIRDFVSRVARTESYLTEGTFSRFVKPGDSKRLCGNIEDHIRKTENFYTREDYFTGAAEICGEIFSISTNKVWHLKEFIQEVLGKLEEEDAYPDIDVFDGKPGMEITSRLAELKLREDSDYITGCIYYGYKAGKIDLTEQLGLLTFLPYELAAALFLLTVD
ncbi:patatin-like phospholipase family protein [Roseburia sp. 499]|uniref:patatin-like phospholipase family protein n=1 Tax=Roseburia sp. 499 TaxID=1261634 RepID=UPI000950C731|nr:patatin-like phospholipase family protein [Roseburia sp. 499]WVK69831.1 patatin-like phospholipase family protein [Roseburia sp. 499]